MSYKTIMLCLNDVQSLTYIIAEGRKLGAKFGAHVTGLYIIPPVAVYGGGEFAPPVVVDESEKYFRSRQAKVRTDFEAAMQGEGLSFSFHLIDNETGDVSGEIIRQSRSADLTITSDIWSDFYQVVGSSFVGQLAVGSGRPLLVLPNKVKTHISTDEIVIGWKDCRESTRAVADALPLLQAAKKVRMVCVDEGVRGVVEAADIATNLARHGVEVDIVNVSSNGMAVGEVLLQSAKDYGASTLVMGAYGHSRFAEFVLGGATRHVLKNPTVPIFLSH
jgi:nucleotide-binding universal stress UspA family protein